MGNGSGTRKGKKTDCICPACGKIHQATFEFGWTGMTVPRVFCKEHKYLKGSGDVQSNSGHPIRPKRTNS